MPSEKAPLIDKETDTHRRGSAPKFRDVDSPA